MKKELYGGGIHFVVKCSFEGKEPFLMGGPTFRLDGSKTMREWEVDAKRIVYEAWEKVMISEPPPNVELLLNNTLRLMHTEGEDE